MMQAMVKEWWHEFTKDKNSFYMTCALAVAVVGFGSFKGYKWHVERREQAAQLAMSEALEEYYKAQASRMLSNDSEEVVSQRIDDARIALDLVISRHGNSNLAPYAHSFDADVAWFAGDKDRALTSMQRAVDRATIPSVRNLLSTKYALMLVDGGGDVQEGLELLKKLAHDTTNSVADYAAYYLGYYYWTKGDSQSAREAWQVLDTFKTEKRPEGNSPWLTAAQHKLSLLS